MAEFNTVVYIFGIVSFTKLVLIHGSKIINIISKVRLTAAFSLAVTVTVTDVDGNKTANV